MRLTSESNSVNNSIQSNISFRSWKGSNFSEDEIPLKTYDLPWYSHLKNFLASEFNQKLKTDRNYDNEFSFYLKDVNGNYENLHFSSEIKFQETEIFNPLSICQAFQNSFSVVFSNSQNNKTLTFASITNNNNPILETSSNTLNTTPNQKDIPKPIHPNHNQNQIQFLPVWDKEGKRVWQYAYNGEKLTAIESFKQSSDEDEDDNDSDHDFLNWMKSKFQHVFRFLNSALIPHDVHSAYWPYTQWKFLQRTVSSILQVHATQALLIAVGVGGRKTLPTAAGLNWVLKNGLGRFGRLAFTSTYGRSFDAELKRVRFGMAVVFTLSLSIEMITPLFPHQFLLLATLANVGKSMALAASIATTPSVLKSFAMSDNLADISAKGQAQTMVAENIGLAISVGMNSLIKNEKIRQMMPRVIFPFLACMDLFFMRKEIKSIPLNSLNKERLEMIIDCYVNEHFIPSPSNISENEKLFFPSSIDSSILPLQISPLSNQVKSACDLICLLKENAKNTYIIRIYPRHHSFLSLLLNNNKAKFLLSFREDAALNDFVVAILQAQYFRKLVEEQRKKKTSDREIEKEKEKERGKEIQNEEIMRHQTNHHHYSNASQNYPNSIFQKWTRSKQPSETSTFHPTDVDFDFDLMEQAKSDASQSRHSLIQGMASQGWRLQPLLLKPSEKHTYSYDSKIFECKLN